MNLRSVAARALTCVPDGHGSSRVIEARPDEGYCYMDPISIKSMGVPRSNDPLLGDGSAMDDRLLGGELGAGCFEDSIVVESACRAGAQVRG